MDLDRTNLFGEIPKVLNAILDLPLDWDFEGREVSGSSEVLRDFWNLTHILSLSFNNLHFHTSVLFLQKASTLVGVLNLETGDTIELVQSRSDTALLVEHLKNKDFDAGLAAAIELLPSDQYGLRWAFMGDDRYELFEIMLDREDYLLSSAGLNQSSVTIVKSRLENLKDDIIANICVDRTFNREELEALFVRLRQNLKRLDPGSGPTTKITQEKRDLLDASKDQVIGIATLYADALPVMITGDIESASLFSTMAAATVTGLLPRFD